jgi:uncharacterized protein (TIGR02147 family)
VKTEKVYLFDYRTCHGYLMATLGGRSMRRGVKAALALAAGCQATYLSQVLKGKAQLSLEQAERVSRYLRHDKSESHFFMLLVLKARAGTRELEEFFSQQIEDLIVQRLDVVKRLGANNTLTDEQKAVYYSSWHFLAIHIALTIPELRTRDALVSHFHLSTEKVDEVLQFLLRIGMIEQNKLSYETKVPVIRLGKDSPHLVQHHNHWRQQAIESLERQGPRDLHYSAVVTLSKEDVMRLKDKLLEEIKANVQTIRESPEEEVYVYNIDFFGMKKTSF